MGKTETKVEKYRKAVFVVVYSLENKEPEYLILKRKLHWNGWEFPKGGLENFWERLFLKNSVKREVIEETGLKPLKITKFDFSGRYKYEKKLGDRPGIAGQEFTLYAAEVRKEKVNIVENEDKEHSDYRWVSYKDAMKSLTWKNQKKSLKIVNDWLKNDRKI